MDLNAEQLRILEDSALAYDRWLSAQQALDAAGPPLSWKTIDGRDYLYESRAGGWGPSHGARDAATERTHAQVTAARADAESALEASSARLATLASQYRALRLPRIHPTVGALCREADRRGLLQSRILVIGTNAMLAYEIEAQCRFNDALRETRDCDFSWRGAQVAIAGAAGTATPIYSLLKAVDGRFTVNSERPWQARDSEGYEVEVLMAPSQAASYPRAEPLRPSALPEQEWLLLGRGLSHVVFDQGNRPARLAVPDPRWMALHKQWLADKPGRNPLKQSKDRAQGRTLAGHVATHMRGYTLDEAFKASVPPELRPYLRYFTTTIPGT